MNKIFKLITLITTVLFFVLTSTRESAYAQEAPFRFSLNRLYENGKISYQISFRKTVDWNMTDITIKIPLPEGTRFLESRAIPSIETTFDGKEVGFFMSAHNRIRRGDALFIVEVTNPIMTVFTTNAWISWKGDYPGDYLTNEVTIDITRKSLDWERPAQPRLQLEATATVDGQIITYYIYPKNIGGQRMWDVKINIPVPEGTTFLSAETPSPFISNFDGQEVSFSAIELALGAEISPLNFKVFTESRIDSPVTTYAWAVWKNSDRRVGTSIVFQEETITGNIVVQPNTIQQVISDDLEDVPYSNYDITSVAFEDYTSAFKLIFHTAGELGPVGGKIDFRLYIDSDCSAETGQRQGGDYRVRYRHEKSRAEIDSWNKDEEQEIWQFVKTLQVVRPVSDKMIAIWVPYNLLELKDDRQFCWWAEAWNKTPSSILPQDYVRPVQATLKLALSGVMPPTPSTTKKSSEGTFIKDDDVWRFLPGWSEPDPAWKTIDFDDSNWFSGSTSIGYGEGKLSTNLNSITREVRNNSAPILVQRTITQTGVVLATLPSGADDVSVFLRRTFAVTEPLTQLILKIDYEDGFVAYLNGVEIARRGLNDDLPVLYDTMAILDHPAGTSEVIDLSEHIDKLINGINLLAIQVHRSTNAPLNLFVKPRLTWQNESGEIALDEDDGYISALPIPPSPGDISGKLAIPIDTGQVTYDLHIFSLPNGQEVIKIPNARQPDFRFDGERLLINREGGGVEDVYEYNFVDGSEKKVSGAPQDWHPVYDPWGNRVAYGNAELTVGRSELLLDEKGEVVTTRHDGNLKEVYRDPHRPFIFVQCGLLPPHQEVEPRCRDIPWLGVLVPAGQVGEIVGTHPVWTSNDMIAYKGCNSWAGSSLCGIYIVTSASTKGFSNGFIPKRLTEDTSDIPTDTQGVLIAFMSAREGNWEAYIMDLNGDGVKNLSNSPDSNDGLPTISPDGNWVAFVSDRGGQWAIWAVPVVGGVAQKLFDFPTNTPWGDGNRAWTNERISWGP